MLFRLYCCEDRRGQQYNLFSALIVHQDISAKTTGLVSDLTIFEMRKISQEIFSIFKKNYVTPRRNFVFDVGNSPAHKFLGDARLESLNHMNGVVGDEKELLEKEVAVARSTVLGFVLYQLSNKLLPNGAGVGCGYYDEEGSEDFGGIAKIMNEYMFNICFDPTVNEANALFFVDYCLSNLSRSFFSDRDESSYFPKKKELSGGLDPIEMAKYWAQHSANVRSLVLKNEDRMVFTSGYTATYRDDADDVFLVLDEMSAELL